MTGRTYRRRVLLLGGVCLLLLLGSMLVGRYGLSAGKLLHMLWTRLTGGAADWSVSDEKVVFAIRLPRIAAATLVGAALAGLAALMGHRAATICTIIAQRIAQNVDTDYKPFVRKMISTALDKLAVLE